MTSPAPGPWKALNAVAEFVAKYEGQELCDVDCDDGLLWRARVVISQRKERTENAEV